MIHVVCDYNGKLESLCECLQLSPNSYQLWSEFMQGVFRKSDAVRKSEIVFLHFIDLPPTGVICIYSALKVVCETANRN